MNTETEETKLEVPTQDVQPLEIDVETRALIEKIQAQLLKQEQKRLLRARVWYDDGSGSKKLVSKIEWDSLPEEDRQRSNNIVRKARL